jgi:signal transduction histidine kinase
VIGDKSRLQQVLLNLLHNAIIFAPCDTAILVEVKFKVHKGIVIKVTDYGMGIPPEDIGKLFCKFRKLKFGQKKNPFGIGLGLYNSRKICRALSGDIHCESQLKKKTTFTFTVLATELPSDLVSFKSGETRNRNVSIYDI